MRLPGRLSAAIAVLSDLQTRKRPASEALRDWGLSNRFAGAGDRAAIGNLVYDALRKRASHAFAMGTDSPRALALSVAVRDWGEDAQALAQSFAGDRFAPDPITDDELARLTAADPLAGASDAVRADLPDWVAGKFARQFGPGWIVEGQGLTQRPALDLRINALKADRARAEKALARFHPQNPPLGANGIRLPAGAGPARTPNIQSDESYLKGWVEIQDVGSQTVSTLAGARPGEQILDYCAGGGGKTLAMAAAMANKGQIFAYDSDRSRLAPIYDRLKRAGARNVQVRQPDSGALDDLSGKMDRVVVDAPCTGSGTWRRRPDAKWRLTEAQLVARCDEQHQILRAAADFVRPGGRLVYITCSLLPEENFDQVRRFLAENPSFVGVDLKDVWQDTFAGGQSLSDQDLSASDLPAGFGPAGGLLTPATTQTDGFFISILHRQGGEA